MRHGIVRTVIRQADPISPRQCRRWPCSDLTRVRVLSREAIVIRALVTQSDPLAQAGEPCDPQR